MNANFYIRQDTGKQHILHQICQYNIGVLHNALESLIIYISEKISVKSLTIVY